MITWGRKIQTEVYSDEFWSHNQVLNSIYPQKSLVKTYFYIKKCVFLVSNVYLNVEYFRKCTFLLKNSKIYAKNVHFPRNLIYRSCTRQNTLCLGHPRDCGAEFFLIVCHFLVDRSAQKFQGKYAWTLYHLSLEIGV